MNPIDYWEECISQSADECGLALTKDQLEYLAEGVKGAHENYDMAFYTPPASDRLADIEREYKTKIKNLENDAILYRERVKQRQEEILWDHRREVNELEERIEKLKNHK